MQLDGHAWTLNPQCVRAVPGSAAELANTMQASQNQRQEPSGMFSSFFMEILRFMFVIPAAFYKLLSNRLVSISIKECIHFFSVVQWLPNSCSSNGQSLNGIFDQLVRASAQGHVDTVQRLLREMSGVVVDTRSGGKTALQVASHQGHSAIVRLLLKAGASVNVSDSDGDTCLHYAAFGNQPEVSELCRQ